MSGEFTYLYNLTVMDLFFFYMSVKQKYIDRTIGVIIWNHEI